MTSDHAQVHHPSSSFRRPRPRSSVSTMAVTMVPAGGADRHLALALPLYQARDSGRLLRKRHRQRHSAASSAITAQQSQDSGFGHSVLLVSLHTSGRTVCPPRWDGEAVPGLAGAAPSIRSRVIRALLYRDRGSSQPGDSRTLDGREADLSWIQMMSPVGPATVQARWQSSNPGSGS